VHTQSFSHEKQCYDVPIGRIQMSSNYEKKMHNSVWLEAFLNSKKKCINRPVRILEFEKSQTRRTRSLISQISTLSEYSLHLSSETKRDLLDTYLSYFTELKESQCRLCLLFDRHSLFKKNFTILSGLSVRLLMVNRLLNR
jgi:hypothetical protein